MPTLESGTKTDIDLSQASAPIAHPAPDERVGAVEGAVEAVPSVLDGATLPPPAAAPEQAPSAQPPVENGPSLAKQVRQAVDTFIMEGPKEKPHDGTVSKAENAVSRWIGKHEFLLSSLLPAAAWSASMPAPNNFIRMLNFALALAAVAATPLVYEQAYSSSASSQIRGSGTDKFLALVVAPAFVPMTLVWGASKALVRGAGYAVGLFNLLRRGAAKAE